VFELLQIKKNLKNKNNSNNKSKIYILIITIIDDEFINLKLTTIYRWFDDFEILIRFDSIQFNSNLI
jgi:hypothetical protein